MPCRSASASLPVAIWYAVRWRDQRGHRVRRRAVHPDLAVPVEGHEPPGRVDQRVDHGQVEPVPLGDLAPVVHAGPAQRVGADPHARRADRVDVEHRGQVVDVGAEEVVRPVVSAARARANGIRWTPGEPGRRSARWPGPRSHFVASVSAGPPCGGLYLKPPSRGGLCDGVTTMPSARPRPSRPRLWREDRVRQRRGRGVAVAGCRPARSRRWRRSTSSAVAHAGSDSAWVSRPRNSGPSMPCSPAVVADRLACRERCGPR